VLRARGWTVRIEPYTGYGADGWVRVLARTLLAGPHVGDRDLPSAGATAQDGGPDGRAVRGWRSFATAQVAGAVLEVTVGGQVHRRVTDRGGYLDAVVPADLPPGRHEVLLRGPDGSTALAPVHVVDPGCRYGLVSDIDDTVMITRLPRPLVAAWNAFVRSETAREPVPGMAGLFRELVGEQDVPVVYLSTGAWNAAAAIGRFLRRHGFPAGPLLLTDWGPTNTGWFRSGREHKRTQLARLMRELPTVRWVLVGDDGQHDPEIFAEAASRAPEHVHAVLLRQLTFAEHVLAHGLPVPTTGVTRAGHGPLRDGVPVLQGPDGHALLDQVRERGIRLDRPD